MKAEVHAANIADNQGCRPLLLGLGHFSDLSQTRRFERVQIKDTTIPTWHIGVQENVPARLELVKRMPKAELRERALQEIHEIARERIRAGASPVQAYVGLKFQEKLDKQYEHLPRRWVVERTHAWIGKNRRMSKDYEYLTETSETMIYIAMIRLMLKRLTGHKGVEQGRKRPKRTAIKNTKT